MKHNKLATLLVSALAFIALSCQEDIIQKPLYPTNVGEEFIEVSVDSLDFQGRGGTLSFSVSASYDVTISSDEWITMSTLSVPGDAREYVVSASTTANKADGAQNRTGHIYVKTVNLQKEVVVYQPFYNRPDIPNPIMNADDLKMFIEEGAPYIESGEVIALGADIDMKGAALETSAEYFNGVLEGNGFTIRNMSGDKPLFDKLGEGASISNLKIDGEYTIGTASSEIYFSPFVGRNYGTITNCENYASVIFNGEYTEKVYAGAFSAYSYAGSKIASCINRGAVKFAAASSTANAYLGGISGYCYGDITGCENYGPINGEASSFTAVYFIGGITPRLQTGAMTDNIVHKEAKIYTNSVSGTGKSYVGGIVGYIDGVPVTSRNKVFADIEVNLTVESYIGALQGWQSKVEIGASQNTTLFEGSVVNSNITAYTKGKAANGNNPCNSAGFVTGRFSGQSGKETLHYGNEKDPIKVSGSMYCLQSDTKLIASAKDFQALLDGDGSKSSVNKGAVPEADYNTIIYEVVGDGQTGPAEDLIIKTGSVKLSIPAEGGESSFTARGNYIMTVKAESDWLEVSNGRKDSATGELIFGKEVTVDGDGSYYDVIVRGSANDHTYAREGKVMVSMPMGSTETVTIVQDGNNTLPATLEVDTGSLVLDPAGQTASKANVISNYDAVVSADANWVSFEPATVPGDEKSHVLSITGAKNQTGEVRTATVTITNKDQVKTISLSQDKFVVPAYTEIKNVDEFIEFIENAFDAELYPAGMTTTLKTDIDLKGRTFSAPSSYAGTFEGNGKSIKNWTCTAPMFGDLTGTVRNLTIDKTCSVVLNGINVSFVSNNNKGLIENCTNNAAMDVKTKALGSAAIRVAPFAAINAGGTVKGCVNNGAITFGNEVDDEQATYIGGMTGSSTGGAFENCRNNAPLTINYNGTKKAYKRIGGMTAICQTAATTFNGCVNTVNGKITILDQTATPLLTNVYGGGIVGEISAKMVSEMRNCKSFGDLYTNVANDAARLGGMWATAGNWATDDMTLLQGCAVNCNIKAVHPSKYGDTWYNPLNSCGLIVGRLGGEKKTLYLGTVEDPVKVAGTVTRLNADGSVDVTVTFDGSNMGLCSGDGSATTANGQGTVQVINAKFEAVTKE